MPTTTPSQTRRVEQVPYHRDVSSDDSSDNDEESSSSDEGDESDSPAPSSLVRGQSMISYDLRRLSVPSRARAISGLTAEYAVDKCRSTRSGFEFQVSDHCRVHLGQGPLTCSCLEYGRSKEACRHIFVSCRNIIPVWIVHFANDAEVARRPTSSLGPPWPSVSRRPPDKQRRIPAIPPLVRVDRRQHGRDRKKRQLVVLPQFWIPCGQRLGLPIEHDPLRQGPGHHVRLQRNDTARGIPPGSRRDHRSVTHPRGMRCPRRLRSDHVPPRRPR